VSILNQNAASSAKQPLRNGSRKSSPCGLGAAASFRTTPFARHVASEQEMGFPEAPPEKRRVRPFDEPETHEQRLFDECGGSSRSTRLAVSRKPVPVSSSMMVPDAASPAPIQFCIRQ
jgi:hypothetical protein